MTNPRKPLTTACLCVFIALALVLSGCAKKPVNPQDPYESLNRTMFGFSMAADHFIVRPITTVYITITPRPLQTGISNAFSNLGEVTTVPNDILQGKFKYALMDTWRFIINSTIGIAGLFDVAAHMGLPKHSEDFGLTLAYYSDNKQAPYLFIPVLGPMTLRSGFAFPVDWITSPLTYLNPASLRYGLRGLQVINGRAQLMSANELIDTAFDPYAFIRSAYLQNRAKVIRDNKHDYRPGEHKTTNKQFITVKGDTNAKPLDATPSEKDKGGFITVTADKTPPQHTKTTKTKKSNVKK